MATTAAATERLHGFLGKYTGLRTHLNTVTLVTAFVLSIMVINNYRQCEDGKGYPEKHPNVKHSYQIAVGILVICCILFFLDILQILMRKKLA